MEDIEGNMEAIVTDLLSMSTEYGVSVLGAVAILIFGWLAAGWAKRALERIFAKSDRVDETIGHFVASMARYAILIFTMIAVLEAFGVETTSLVAVMGAMGLAIGFALQGTLANVASGVMILFFRPFKVGDYIETSAGAGTVKSIGLFITEMNTSDNVLVIVPNGEVWGGAIKNFSRNERRRADLEIGVGYDSDLDHAIRVITEVLVADDRVDSDPEPLVAITALGDSSVTILVRFWCERGNFFRLKLHMNKTIKQRLDAEGISIPFPQMDVHVIQP